ncbi:hypothetical protein FOZ63_006409, partial [Perkinsus olseni]
NAWVPIDLATASPLAVFTSKTATLAPFAARARAVVSPRPEAPPMDASDRASVAVYPRLALLFSAGMRPLVALVAELALGYRDANATAHELKSRPRKDSLY